MKFFWSVHKCCHDANVNFIGEYTIEERRVNQSKIPSSIFFKGTWVIKVLCFHVVSERIVFSALSLRIQCSVRFRLTVCIRSVTGSRPEILENEPWNENTKMQCQVLHEQFSCLTRTVAVKEMKRFESFLHTVHVLWMAWLTGCVLSALSHQ